jgi:hypothetical protein
VVALVNVAVFGARKRNEDACESSLSLRVERLGGGPISLFSGWLDKRGFILAGCSSEFFVFVPDAYTEAFWSA